MGLIDENTRNHLKKEFKEKLGKEVRIIFVHGENCQYCKEIETLIRELEEISEGKIKIEKYNFHEDREILEKYNVEMYPALVLLTSSNSKGNIKFYGIPSGYEFISLIESIFMLSQGKTRLSEEAKHLIKNITKPVKIQVFVTPTCPHCPRAVIMAHQFAIENPNIESHMVEAMEFSELSMKYNIMAVPKVVINEGRVMFEGALPEPYFLEKIIESVR